MDDLEWNDLRLLLAVCRAGTLSGAARSLGVYHSTVFRRVNAIEARLGVRLFERLPTGYVMTEAGEAIQQSAERIETELFGLSRKLLGRDLALRGTLRVTAPEGLALKLLTPHLVRFCQTHADIRMDLLVTSSALELAHREADVAVRVTATPPEAMIGRRIARFAATLYGSKAYLHRQADRDPKEFRYLVADDGVDWLADHPDVRIGFRSNSLVAILEVVRHGLGVAILPCFLGDREPELQRVTDPPTPPTLSLWLLIHPDLKHTARVRALVDFLTDVLSADRPLIEGRR